MRSNLTICMFIIATGSVFSQQVEIWSDVPVLLDSYGHKISSDGSFSTGEAISSQSSWARDNLTGEIFYFDGVSCGDGNNITKDHIVVGTDKYYMKAAFLMPQQGEDPILISSLKKFTESYAHGINWEGTRLVGFVSNPKGSDMDETNPELQNLSYLPIYCDVDPVTLTVSDPVFLPVPPTDLLGRRPQYCTAFWISDDGATILGQVIDSTGHYAYPIVYTQSTDGEWSYTLPSEKLFNPNKIEIPKWPVPEMSQPNPVNFIGKEEYKVLFQTMLNEYITGESEINPYLLLDPSIAGTDALMTIEEYQKYLEAEKNYEEYYKNEYQPLLDKYNDEIAQIISQSTFFMQSSMAMNRDGSLIGQSKLVTRMIGNLPTTFLNPVIFNIKDGSYKIYGNDFEELEISQILPDGTLIGVSPQPGPTSPDYTPQHSYVCAPNSNTFVKIEDYIKNSNPEIYNWMEEYLLHDVPIGLEEDEITFVYKELMVTGQVAVDDNFSALSAGVDGWSWNLVNGEYFSYFFTDVKAPDTAVDKINHESDSTLKIYNLQGVKIVETNDKSSISTIPSGIYIINGKKIWIK